MTLSAILAQAWRSGGICFFFLRRKPVSGHGLSRAAQPVFKEGASAPEEISYPSVFSSGVIAPFSIVRNPTEIGSENRRGPALPGLKNSTPFRHSILG